MRESQCNSHLTTKATMIQKISTGIWYSMIGVLIGAQTLQISLAPESELYQRIEPNVTFIVLVAGASATMVLLVTASLCILVDTCTFFIRRYNGSRRSLLPKPATETPIVVHQYIIKKAGYQMLVYGLIVLDAVAWSDEEDRHTLFMEWLVEALKFDARYLAFFVGFTVLFTCIAYLVKKWKATHQPAVVADPENVPLIAEEELVNVSEDEKA